MDVLSGSPGFDSAFEISVVPLVRDVRYDQIVPSLLRSVVQSERKGIIEFRPLNNARGPFMN
jgi:hypothetical protein